MGSYNFTLNAAQQIVATVKKVKATPTDTTGANNPSLQPGTSFWALLTSPGDISGKFWDWVQVCPDASGVGSTGVSSTVAISSAWKIAEPHVVGVANAREANDMLNVPTGTVVRMTFVGYAVPDGNGYAAPPGTSINDASTTDLTGTDGTVPFYVFEYQSPPIQPALPLHDHRDNFNGGFAFAVFHPGTGIPQMPWSV